MLLANAFLPDPRVLKEAGSLANRGYQITILAWDREGQFPPLESVAGFVIKRIRVRSKFNRRMAQLPKILLLWWHMIAAGLRENPHVIHCHDLDTLFPGLILKLLTKKPLIYDAHENYALVKSGSLPKFFVRALGFAEKKLLNTVDVIITASTFVADEFRRVCTKPLITLGNYWQLSNSSRISPADVVAEKRRLGIPEGNLIVAYIGGLKGSRKIMPLLQAVKDGMGVSIIICGAGEQESLVEREAQRKKCVFYLGRVPFEQVPLYASLSDVIYYGLDNYPGALYNCPNALFMALSTGKAVLATDIGDLGKIVREENCGVVLKRTDGEEIREALRRFQDGSQLRILQNNALAAARSKYNWGAAEKLLLETYGQLLQLH